MLRRKFPGQEGFHVPGGVVLAGVGILFALLLASRMGLAELLALGFTAILSFLNWLAVRRNNTGDMISVEHDDFGDSSGREVRTGK
jgi:hypothetical protein